MWEKPFVLWQPGCPNLTSAGQFLPNVLKPSQCEDKLMAMKEFVISCATLEQGGSKEIILATSSCGAWKYQSIVSIKVLKVLKYCKY